MLTMLRKKHIAKKVLWFLAIIIIPAFVLWGAGSLSKKKLPFKYIGTVDGKKVSVDAFIKSLRDVQTGLFLNYFSQPQALNKIQTDRKLLNRLAWENIVINRIAKKDKIIVSDREVINFITGHPLFSRGGEFDEKLYRYILKNSLGLVPRTFEESVRNFLINTKCKSQIVRNVTVSNDELLGYYRNEFEKAKVDYVVIDKKDFKEDARVSESEISAFYKKNKERFREPEKVILAYIAFPHRETGTKEKVMENLKRVYEKIKRRPRDMEKIAHGLDMEIGETPPFSREEIVPEIAISPDTMSVSFQLRPLVDVLPIISESEEGISYIIMVKSKIPPSIKPQKEVSSYIAEMIGDEKSARLAEKEARRIYDEAKSGNIPLDKIAKANNLVLLSAGFTSRFDYIKGVGESYRIIDEAFKLKLGDISEPVKVRKGFVLMEPVEFQFIDAEVFEKEKENYRNKVLAAKKIKFFEVRFAEEDVSLNVDLNNI